MNSKYLDFHVVSLDPDKYSFSYHFYRASEELFMVLSGEAALRSPEGFQKVSEGDIIFFEQGSTGAHQLYNYSDNQFLMVCRENEDSTSMKLFEAIIDDEQIHFNYFDSISSHITKLGSSYLSDIAGTPSATDLVPHGFVINSGGN